MKRVLVIAPMGSVHRRFNKANIEVLLELGYEVHLAANFSVHDDSEKLNDEFVAKCRKEGIIVHHISFRRAVNPQNILLIKKLKRIIDTYNFDIIHAHTETGGLLLRIVMLFSQKNFKAIYTPHGMSFYKGSPVLSQLIYRPIEKWICLSMDKNIAMNEEELYVLKNWKFSAASYVHGVGIEISSFKVAVDKKRMRKELGIPDNAFLITSVGELNHNKNHSVVIEAVSELNQDNIYYLICGVGGLKEELLKDAEKKKVNLNLLGFRRDIPKILKISDLFVFPSFHEGLPVSVMEAMAVGLPVVCSNIRGNVDLIDKCGGFLCAPDNPKEFAKAIKTLLSDEEIRRKMGEYNANKSKLYDISNIKEELRSIYSE